MVQKERLIVRREDALGIVTPTIGGDSTSINHFNTSLSLVRHPRVKVAAN